MNINNRYCGCGCGAWWGYCLKHQPTNQSNRTINLPTEGASWVTDYKAYHPEDTRTEQEIIDAQVWQPATYVPNTAQNAGLAYSQEQVQSILDELRAVKQALIDKNLMENNP